jgi:hypothetical protein
MECVRELAPAAGVAAGAAGAAVEATIGGLMALPIGAALLASELAGDQEMTTDASGAPVPVGDNEEASISAEAPAGRLSLTIRSRIWYTESYLP